MAEITYEDEKTFDNSTGDETKFNEIKAVVNENAAGGGGGATTFQELTDKDTIYHGATAVPLVGDGVLTIDMDNNYTSVALLANATSVSLTNGPPNITGRGRYIIDVVQGGAGSFTINWTGSGVTIPIGLTASSFQPETGVGTLSQYLLEWAGTSFVMTLTKFQATPL